MTEVDGTTFKPTQDGAFEVMIDKKAIRLVKETDLLSLKGANEERATKWDTERVSNETKVKELANAQETTRQQLLQEQAAKEQLLSKYKDYDTHVSRVGELTKEIDTHKSTLQKAHDELALRIKSGLTTYGASEESLKDKNLEQLRNLEEAAKILGKQAPQGKQARYDGGGHNGTPPAETAYERASRIVAAAEEKYGKVKVASK